MERTKNSLLELISIHLIFLILFTQCGINSETNVLEKIDFLKWNRHTLDELEKNFTISKYDFNPNHVDSIPNFIYQNVVCFTMEDYIKTALSFRPIVVQYVKSNKILHGEEVWILEYIYFDKFIYVIKDINDEYAYLDIAEHGELHPKELNSADVKDYDSIFMHERNFTDGIQGSCIKGVRMSHRIYFDENEIKYEILDAWLM